MRAGRTRKLDASPDLNVIYFNSDFGRHHLGANGRGFIIANDFGQNHIAARLRYAGETETAYVYDIVGLGGPQHAYQKDAEAGQYGVWYRPRPDTEFFFWFYANREENSLPPPNSR
jgi:hypothetical protein